jgi:phosphatidylinositol alpha-1,6-mannosyltransferase
MLAVSTGPRVLALLTDAWGGGGGIAQYNRDLVRALVAAGAAVDAACYGVAVDDGTLPRGATIVHASRSRAGFLRAAAAAARGPRSDLVLCGHLHLAPVAAWLARRLRAPLWLQLHGIDAWPRPSRWRRAACARTDLATAVSRCTRERVLAWWDREPERVRVLPNTVDETFVPGARDAALAARLGIDGGPVLLTVGRLAAAERYKGHDRVIDALPALRATWPQLVYVIAGEGDDRARLVARAGERGVSAQVRFVGAVPHADLPALYRLADGFAMPSTGEGFGIAFLEAMACGVPALGLDGDGSRDPLADGELGVVCRADDLVDGLRRLLDPARERGEPLARRVRARFGRAPFEAQVARLLARLHSEAA